MRSKQNAESIGETKQATPNDYAEEKLRSTVEEISFETERVVKHSTQKSAKAIKNTKPIKRQQIKSARLPRKRQQRPHETKALISALMAGGSTAGIVIIVICLIGLLVGSCFGIFFLGEDTGNGMSMQTAIAQINM